MHVEAGGYWQDGALEVEATNALDKGWTNVVTMM
jgi:hypothetical protein